MEVLRVGSEPITATASINKIQTLADGGLRWTFDLPETAVMQSAELMAIRQAGAAVELVVKPVEIKREYGGRLK